MRAMRAEQFSGYEALRLVELPKPTVTDGKVLVRITAAGTVTRAGFERMVAAVCLDKAGAVAAREVSRFARNSREW